MRIRLTVSFSDWTCLALLAITLGMVAPATAQVRRESTLNGVTINSGCLEVLKALGMPQYIGPALPGAAAIEKILNPPPEMATMTGPAAPMAPAGPGMPDPGLAAGPPKPKPEEEYIVWMYQGVKSDGSRYTVNLNGGHCTYVILDKYGKVVGVVVAVDNPNINPGIYTASRDADGKRVGFGTRLIDMVKVFDWPEPFARIDKYYFCAYPDRNITFSLDTATRKVVVMALGMPVTVIRGAEKTDAANNGILGGAGLPGGLPGGMVLPR
jgi:hypothetical protein